MTTADSGSGTITVGADKAVSGSMTTTGVNGTAAHIHMAAMGQNGPVSVPLAKMAMVPAQWRVFQRTVTGIGAQYKAEPSRGG